MAAGRTEERGSEGGISASTLLTGEFLPQLFSCTDGNNQRRSAWLVRHGYSNKAGALPPVEIFRNLRKCLADSVPDVVDSHLADILLLLRGIPLGCFRFLATDRSEHVSITDFMLPVFHKNLKVRLTSLRKATPVKVAIVVNRYSDGSGNHTSVLLDFFFFFFNDTATTEISSLSLHTLFTSSM